MTTQHNVQALIWQHDKLLVLDQRLLPHQEHYIECQTAEAVYTVIRDMAVRGAPAIGIAAAYGVALAGAQSPLRDVASWQHAIQDKIGYLRQSRPTAVNLFWALDRMQALLANLKQINNEALVQEAIKIHEEDIAANQTMARLGSALIQPTSGVLTHCNTGSLATGGVGTALGVVVEAYKQRRVGAVFADETRPWMQGSRLTAWECQQEGVPATLVVEGAAASLMRAGKVQWVIVGSDRVAANGDVANKIGTYSLAVLARAHNVKMMVVAPSTTVDLKTPTGSHIEIEARSEEEILSYHGQRIAPAGARAWNPVFDVTPAHLVDALVTEKGVVLSPNASKIQNMMAN